MKRGSRRESQGCSRVSALSGAGKGCPVDVSNLKVHWKRCRRGHARQDGLLVESWEPDLLNGPENDQRRLLVGLSVSSSVSVELQRTRGNRCVQE